MSSIVIVVEACLGTVVALVVVVLASKELSLWLRTTPCNGGSVVTSDTLAMVQRLDKDRLWLIEEGLGRSCN